MRSLVHALPLALLLPASALAVPLQLSQQGRLLDDAGAPLEGSHSLGFSLYDAATGGTPVWTETLAVDLDGGYYSATLGATTPLDSATFEASALWIGLSVDGTELDDRTALSSVPYAIRAGNLAAGAVIDASEIRIGGATIIDGSGKLSSDALPDISGDGDTLAELSCAADELARFDGSVWTCAAADDHTHAADAIIDGTLDVARIPVGTSSGTVAAGDHGHDALAMSGDLSAANGSFSGAVQVGTSTATCDTSTAGSIRYDSAAKAVMVCDGATWFPLPVTRLGESAANPGKSCKDIFDAGEARGDGAYWIDPDGDGPFQVVCSMGGDGGWTLLMKGNGDCTWKYDADLWTKADTLAPTSLNENATVNAKFESFNRLAVKEVKATFPTINHTMRLTWASPTIPLTGFQKATDLGDVNTQFYGGWPRQGGYQDYGIELVCTNHAKVRWGWMWNNEGTCDSNDASAGIGMSCDSGSRKTAIGGWATCCSTQPNGNYPTPVLMWGR